MRAWLEQTTPDWSDFRGAGIALILVAAALMGGLIALGSPLLNLLLLGGLSGLAMLAIRPFPMLVIQLVVATLLVGQLTYFAGISQAIWIPYGLALLLFLRLPDAYAGSPFYHSQAGVPFMLPVLAFFVLVLLSALINGTSVLQAVVGGKNLLALWSIYLVIALFAVSARQVEKIIHWLIPLALLQLPFVLYQFFFVASSRSSRGGVSGLAWDAIVGSFGGDPLSGGASGVMAFSLVSAMLLVIALRRRQQTGSGLLFCVLAVAMFCIALAEIKVVMVLFPLGLAVLFFRDIQRRPWIFLLGLVVSAGFMVTVLYAYDAIHYASTGRSSASFVDLFDRAFGYSFDPSVINHETGEMGRMAAFYLWWQDGFSSSLLQGLFGYGPGASRASTIAFGEIAQRYAFRIDRSAATQMLWEIGLAGYVLFMGILLAAAATALKLAGKYAADPARQATLELVAAVLVMAVPMSAYGKDLIEVPALGLFVMVALGYVAQLAALTRSDGRLQGCEG